MSTLSQQRKLVEQLRQEANLNRRPVSECVQEMIVFMEQNREKDCLVSGFANTLIQIKPNNDERLKTDGLFESELFVDYLCSSYSDVDRLLYFIQRGTLRR
ncbi:unnamed protein product [Schistosoma mattheei]|uniref:Uncharacterized protein n=1 Tax=Schistosoma mattheei TaxID=31246 RepID=A0A183PQQ5_9TREM|nr:unnamed protein product [Schistosoma mattheei]